MRAGEIAEGGRQPGAPPDEPATPLDPGPESERAFQTEGRGIVDSSGPGFYVVRRSDEELYERLTRREPCYVLAPRQIGKSSLRIRTQQRLRAEGVRCVSVDLTSVGSGSSADEWYFSIAATLHEELELPGDLEDFWKKHRRMSPVRRFRQFLHDLVLAEGEGEGEEEKRAEAQAPAVVIFLDEIDVTLSLPFPRDDFFGLIRSAHEARAESPRWRRLTFCLIGVATPLDLVADPERTPFNNSFEVRIDDFTLAEARTFAPGLAFAGGSAEALLDAVLGWTGGHPALTQRLCYNLTRHGAAERARPERARVDALVSDLFLASGRITDPILLDAERRFAGDRQDARIPVMLHLYRRLLDGEPVPADGNNPRQFGLRIAGLAAEREEDLRAAPGAPDAGEAPRSGRGTFLRVRNRIFARVFNHAWVEEKLARRFLTEPLQIWKDSGRKDDHVLRGESLQIALTWSKGREDITPDEHDFLQASMVVQAREQTERQQAEIERTRRERAEQQVRSQRRIVSVLAGSFAAVAVSLVFAIVQYEKTQLALTIAEKQRIEEQQTKKVAEDALERQLEQAKRALEEARAELDRKTTERVKAAEEELRAHDEWQKAERAAKEAEQSPRGGALTRRKLQDKASGAKAEATRLADARRKAVAAELAAQRRYNEAVNEVTEIAGMPPAAESVAGSVQGAIEAQQGEMKRLRDQIEEQKGQIGKLTEQSARLEVVERELKLAQETNDRLKLELEGTRRQLDSARREGGRFATPPAPGEKKGQGTDVYAP